MERRLILAITLSILILISWSAFTSKTQTIGNKGVITKTTVLESTQPSAPEVQEAIPSVKEIPSKEPASLVNFAQDKIEVIFNESEAAIDKAVFKQYQNHEFYLKNAFSLDKQQLNFQKGKFTPEAATFTFQDQEKKIIKHFIFANSNNIIMLDIEIKNISSAPIVLNPSLSLGTLQFAGNAEEARFKDITVSTEEKMLHLNARKEMVLPVIKFIGLRDRYFCLIVEPFTKDYTGFIKKINAMESEIILQDKELSIAPGVTLKRSFRIYLGPQDLTAISGLQPEWTAVLYFGTFNFFSHILLQVLNFIYNLVHNWGVAVILLSILVYLVLFPLSLKQIRSMKEMQRIQPHIEELRKKYKDNPQKLNTEIMSLYREHKVNPFGGCLPMVLQIPVFFALYQALMRSVALKGAHFLWIKDLASPDRLITLNTALPLIGNDINILPVLMMIVMFVQQKVSTAAATGAQAEQQRIMLIVFPLMFGVIFYRMPSGLVLYWFVNSLLMVLQQLKLYQKS